MMVPVREELPPCYGKEWDSSEPACKGGVDPAFKHETLGNVRPKCDFFESCGVKFQASKMESARGLIDPRSLVKQPPTLMPAKPQGQNQTAAFVERFAQSLQQQMPQPVMFQPPPQMPKPGQYYPQQQVPVGYQQMMPVNYQMPGYLSVPEHRHPEESFFSFAMRTIFRSMGKSAGHSVAHLFDTQPLAPYPPHGNGGSSSGG